MNRLRYFFQYLLLVLFNVINVLSLSSAADNIEGNAVTGIVDVESQSWLIDNIINPLVAFAGAIAFCLFLYGMIIFLKNRATKPDDAANGKLHMFYGTIGLFVIFTVWQIMTFVGSFIPNSVGLSG